MQKCLLMILKVQLMKLQEAGDNGKIISKLIQE